MSEKIIDTIRKLLDLAKNNSNENEAASAFATAQRLQTQYRISSLTIEDFDSIEFVSETIEETKNIITWRSTLIGNIAFLNGCKAVHRRRGEMRNILTIFGQKQNIEICKVLYESIAQQIEWRTKMVMAERNGDKLGAKTYANNYRLGMLQTITRRMKEQNEEAKRNPNAIVLVHEMEKVNESYEKKYGSSKIFKPIPPARSREAFLKGLQDGEKVVLKGNKGIL